MQDTPYHHHSDYDEHTDFVGEAQVVNAGYTVDESIDPHGYLMSSYENIKKPEKVTEELINLLSPKCVVKPDGPASCAARCFAATTQKPINIGVCVAK